MSNVLGPHRGACRGLADRSYASTFALPNDVFHGFHGVAEWAGVAHGSLVGVQLGRTNKVALGLGQALKRFGSFPIDSDARGQVRKSFVSKHFTLENSEGMEALRLAGRRPLKQPGASRNKSLWLSFKLLHSQQFHKSGDWGLERRLVSSPHELRRGKVFHIWVGSAKTLVHQDAPDVRLVRVEHTTRSRRLNFPCESREDGVGERLCKQKVRHGIHWEGEYGETSHNSCGTTEERDISDVTYNRAVLPKGDEVQDRGDQLNQVVRHRRDNLGKSIKYVR
eukprot:6482131-Amphidinium_carterae.2